MTTSNWVLDILDADPPADKLVCLATGHLDDDGEVEVVTGGETGLFWYRPATHERGVVDRDVWTMVGLELADVDDDGRDEVVTSVLDRDEGGWKIEWYDPGPSLDGDWTRHVVDSECLGGPHDICYVDVDDDGDRELVVNAAFTDTPGVVAYDPPPDPTDEWDRHVISLGKFSEGLAVGDIDGDGRSEVVNGPDVFSQPSDGPFADEWRRDVYAPSLRSFCRTALVDVTGDGTLDIVAAESEYPDCRLAWFENLGASGWRQHVLDRGLYNVHSLAAWRTDDVVTVFAAEMAEGGWGGHYRWDAEQFSFSSADNGDTWSREVLARGAGTHEATPVDVDGDGGRAFVGKEANHPVVHLLRRTDETPVASRYTHRLLDRDKPSASTDVLTADIDGDGRTDVVTGRWWYRWPDWRRFEIPGVSQVHASADIDGDGRVELVASTGDTGEDTGRLTSDLVWLRPVDPVAGDWERHRIGEGTGDWIQGSAVAPIGSDGALAFVANYHPGVRDVPPDLFVVPDDPTDPWHRRRLADIPAGEDVLVADLTDSGRMDVVVGNTLVENRGDGEFEPHRVLPAGFSVARLAAGDLSGNGRLDVVAGEDPIEFSADAASLSRTDGFDEDDSRLRGPGDSLDSVPMGRLAWFERPPDPRTEWPMHVVDTIRRPRSVDVADLDGDGVPELVAGEHDPSWRYRSQSRLFAYERADPSGETWTRHLIEDRFEHNAGAKVVSVGDDTTAVLSHGWSDTKYLHLWERSDEP